MGLEPIVRRYSDSDSADWDDFVHESANGTFLQTRRYLSHHGDRFVDESRVVVDQTGRIVAVLPAARGTADGEVISHPGLTFGGLVYGRELHGLSLEAVLAAVVASLGESGFNMLDYRPVPSYSRLSPGDDDSFAMYRIGATGYSRGLAAVIDVPHAILSKSRQGCAKKAVRVGVELTDDWSLLPEYWILLTSQLLARHHASPVHSLEEMQQLGALFPESIFLRTALLDGDAVAGAICYRYHSDVLHTQYLCSDDRGRASSALDLVLTSLMDKGGPDEPRLISLGTSNDPTTGALDEALFNYKRSFGASGHTTTAFHVDCPAP